VPFCIQCGLRVDPGEQTCAACQAREAGVPVCKRCGMIARSADAQFCIQCGNRFPVKQGPQGQGAPSSPPPPAAAQAPPAPQTAPPPSAAHQTAAAPPAPAPPQPTHPLQAQSTSLVPPAPPNVPPEPSILRDETGAGRERAGAPVQPGSAPGVRAVEEVGQESTPAGILESVGRRREATYHRLGRTLLTLCYQGKLPYEQLPEDLAREVREGIDRIRRGHAELIAAGICPSCQKPALAGTPPKCSECGYQVED
jgi:hypothetical protein